MTGLDFKLLVDSLGKTYQELIDEQVINHALEEIYPDSLGRFVQLHKGVSMSFWAETSRYEALHITLKEIDPEFPRYVGELPHPFSVVKNRDEVRSYFGIPLEAEGPIKLPFPVGMTGGWDGYSYSASDSHIRIQFQYDTDLNVDALVFVLADTSRH